MKKSALLRSLFEHPVAPHPEQQGKIFLQSLLYPKAWDMLLPISQPFPEKTEDLVHDTRVACRRWVEALDLVKTMVGPKAYQRTRKFARQLRKALGQGREADVLFINFQQLIRHQPTDSAAIQAVQSVLSQATHTSLDEVRDTFRPKRLLQAGEDIVRMVQRYRKDLGWRDLLGPHLYARTLEVDELVPFMKEPHLAEAHHDLRVAFKRLRYTAEITESVFAQPVGERFPRQGLKRLQDILGNLQDSHDLVRFLEDSSVTTRLKPRSLAMLQELARKKTAQHYEMAAQAVETSAPAVLGQLRRIAGKVGHLEPQYS